MECTSLIYAIKNGETLVKMARISHPMTYANDRAAAQEAVADKLCEEDNDRDMDFRC